MNSSLTMHLQRQRMIFCNRIPIILFIGTLLIPGCAAYRFGTQGLYPPHIQTVYVPVFKSDNLRPGMGAWLTEAVVK